MAQWSGSYEAWTGKNPQSPVYMMIIGEQTAEMSDSHTLPNESATSFYTFNSTAFDPLPSDPIFCYESDGWEFMKVQQFTADSTATEDKLDLVARAQYGSPAHSFSDQARIILPKFIFTSGAITGLSILEPHQWMEIPGGSEVSIQYMEGRTNIEPASIMVHDVDNRVTQAMKNFTAVGQRAVLLGGYVGLQFNAFSMLTAGTITAVAIRDGIYTFRIDLGMDTLNTQLHGQYADASPVLNANMTAGQSTITLTSDSAIHQTGTTSVTIATDQYAAFYFKVDNEIMRHTGGAASPTYNVARGELGTTAATHTAGASVSYFFSIQDNPINILLYCLLSSSARDTGTWGLFFGDSDDDAVGVGWPPSDIDVTSFTDARDLWFVNDTWRLDFPKRTRMRQFIEQHILSPLNCHLAPDRAGRLTLFSISPPTPGDAIPELTESDIVGVPELMFDNKEIINDVTVQWEYDFFNDSYSNSTTTLNATSQATYNVDGQLDVEARGVSSTYAGSQLAAKYGRRKVRNGKAPAPPVTAEVLFHKGAAINVGDTITLNHAFLPDPYYGLIGWNHLMLVTGKRIRWDEGTVTLTMIKTNYGSERIGLIAPSTQADYTSASAAEQLRYAFWGDSNNTMSNGDEGYVIT